MSDNKPVDSAAEATAHWEKTRRDVLTRRYIGIILGITSGILVFIMLISAIAALEIPGVYRDTDGNRWRLALHGFRINGWIVHSGAELTGLPELGEPSRWDVAGNNRRFFNEPDVRVRGSWVHRNLGGVAFSVRDRDLWFANGDRWSRV